MRDFFDFLKDLIQAGIDRLKFPFLNSFVISWAILNWKAILIVLFSEKPIEQRIKTVLDGHVDIWINFFFPLILAFFFVGAVPFMKWCFYWALKKINQKNRDNDMDYIISSFKKKIELAEQEVALE